MSRFMGGFATAAAILTAATVAGRMWLPVGFALTAAVPAVWLMVRASRHRDLAPVQRDPHAEPHVFAARGDVSGRPPRDRR